MRQLEEIAGLRAAIRQWRQNGETIVFVPTMGNLHAGHIELVKRAKTLGQKTVVSIFVNPLQFGPNEDFAAYPRTLEQDREKLRAAGVDLLFTPTAAAVYPQGLQAATRVEVSALSDILCGAFRPGHFAGVATVVAKLFNLVQPDVAVFGKKDYQQWRLIEIMVRDLAFPVTIIGVETVREADGLAMSSRNQYLQAQERQLAPELYRCLSRIRVEIESGNRNFTSLESGAIRSLENMGFKPQYVEIRSAHDLSRPTADEALVVLAAAFIGKTRLIDNLEIIPKQRL
ncbi:MAG TPA: pantoate--beta-alanine ligase [Gammaproteobacteria bacterium]